MKRRSERETIAFDDERMTYYYKPWERSMTGDGPVIHTANYNDYVDIWYVRLTHLEWWSERSPTGGMAGFKIWGKNWEVQELISLYSPTKDSKIELIQSWDFEEDDYTITLLNPGEKDPEAIGSDLVHAYFIISI
jgi:hypothetical protein